MLEKPLPSNVTADRPVPREELCGKLVGNRRVRVERPPRGVGRKIASIIRRTVSR